MKLLPFPPSKSLILPLVTPIKNNLSVVLILQSRLLNVFAACHGRAIWFTNNTLHLTAFLSFLFYTGSLFQRASLIFLRHLDLLWWLDTRKHMQHRNIMGWNAVLLLWKVYSELRKGPWVLSRGQSLPNSPVSKRKRGCLQTKSLEPGLVYSKVLWKIFTQLSFIFCC